MVRSSHEFKGGACGPVKVHVVLYEPGHELDSRPARSWPVRMPEPPLDDPISKEPFWDEVLEQAQRDGYEGSDGEGRVYHSRVDAIAERSGA